MYLNMTLSLNLQTFDIFLQLFQNLIFLVNDVETPKGFIVLQTPVLFLLFLTFYKEEYN